MHGIMSFTQFNEAVMRVSHDYDSKMGPEELVHQRIQKSLKNNDGFTRGHVGHALELYAEKADIDKVNEVIKDYDLEQKFGFVMVRDERSGKWSAMIKKVSDQPPTAGTVREEL